MKIKAIASLLKEHKIIELWDAGDTQWISNGRAAYPLYGMPRLDEETVMTVMDIPEKDRDKYMVNDLYAPTNLNLSDYDDTERRLLPQLLTIGYGGEVLMPARTSLGLMFIDPAYLKPIDENYELFERESGNGDLYVAVKAGLLLKAIILPKAQNAEDIAERLSKLLDELRQTISRIEQPAEEYRDAWGEEADG